MRLLIANPNTSKPITKRIEAAARAAASPGTQIVAVTAQFGVPYIVTRAEAAIAAHATLDLMANANGSCDAAVVAAFGDPGLDAARELMTVPVVGLAEASMLTACMIGRRFALVSFASAFAPWYRDSVERLGLSSRLAAVRCLRESFTSAADVQEEKEAALVDLCRLAVEEDEADVIILAGAPLAGLAARVGAQVQVPVLDCVAAAVRQAEMLAGLQFTRAAKMTTPTLKSMTGVSDALARLYKRSLC